MAATHLDPLALMTKADQLSDRQPRQQSAAC